MPDQLNKQAIVNLLIDSPLREPIKINLIDIVNNTTEPDLPKIFPTIVKELEIFQKATERRMKLAEETITKLGGTAGTSPTPPAPSATPTVDPVVPAPAPTPASAPMDQGLTAPKLDLPPLPTAPVPATPIDTAPVLETNLPPSSEVTPPAAPLPTPEPLGGAAPSAQGDEAALAEIQKELDSLKTSSAEEITAAAVPAPAAPPAPQV